MNKAQVAYERELRWKYDQLLPGVQEQRDEEREDYEGQLAWELDMKAAAQAEEGK